MVNPAAMVDEVAMFTSKQASISSRTVLISPLSQPQDMLAPVLMEPPILPSVDGVVTAVMVARAA
jgi:hypothetical protein